jgi:hypothetical protein
MESVPREASQEDYEAVCALLAQVDRIHAEALPEVFRPVEGPARSREWFAAMLAAEHTALFVAEQQGTLLVRCLIACGEAIGSGALLHAMAVFAPVAIMLIVENPADDFADMDCFVEVSFAGHGCRAITIGPPAVRAMRKRSPV